MSAMACGDGAGILRQPHLGVRQAVERERLQPLVFTPLARLSYFAETLQTMPGIVLLQMTKAAPILAQQGFAQVTLPAEDRLSLPIFRDGLAGAGIAVVFEGVLQQTASLRQCPSARRRRRTVNAREIRDVPVAAFAFGQGAQIAQHLPPCQSVLRPFLLGERERIVNQSGGYMVAQTKVAAAEDTPDPLFIAGLMRLLKSDEKPLLSLRHFFIPLFDQFEIAPGIFGPGGGRVLFQVVIPVFFCLE